MIAPTTPSFASPRSAPSGVGSFDASITWPLMPLVLGTPPRAGLPDLAGYALASERQQWGGIGVLRTDQLWINPATKRALVVTRETRGGVSAHGPLTIPNTLAVRLSPAFLQAVRKARSVTNRRLQRELEATTREGARFALNVQLRGPAAGLRLEALVDAARQEAHAAVTRALAGCRAELEKATQALGLEPQRSPEQRLGLHARVAVLEERIASLELSLRPTPPFRA